LGTDQAGGAIGSGVILVFPAHMNKILALDSNKGVVDIQPGLNYGKLQQTLYTHGQFLPPFPASLEYSTIGGAIANNAAGEKTIKYGVTKDYVRSLRVVLANGEVIKTGRLSRREVNQKMGQATLEGEIYRALIGLINDNKDVISKTKLKLAKNSAGYDIWSVKNQDGSVDLTPLIVGSQGTLGIITEAVIETEGYNPSTSLIVGFFDDLDEACKIVLKLRQLEPSSLEMVDEHLLNFVDQNNPNQLKNVIGKPFPKLVVMVEFDDGSKRIQNKKLKKVTKLFEQKARNFIKTTDIHQQEDLWKIRHSAATVMSHNIGNKKALPAIEDGAVPPEMLNSLIKATYDLFNSYNLEVAIWGHAGNAHLHMQPFFDLAQVGDRQKIFKLMNDYYKMVIDFGGTISAEHNDGRLRAPYLKLMYGEDVYGLFAKIKEIFDPYGILNSGVKIGTTVKDLQALMRHEYSMHHLYDHMPRT
jgi:FAD/FMN-containing dehydrogenase